jgi:hypothetical protein
MNNMMHIITGTPKFDRDYFRFLHEYLSKKSRAEILKEAIVFDDSYITDYDIFESVADFACKNMVNRIDVKSGSPLEFYYYELKPEHRFYYSMRQGWTCGINKYIMCKFDGEWIYIPKNKYTLVR